MHPTSSIDHPGSQTQQDRSENSTSDPLNSVVVQGSASTTQGWPSLPVELMFQIAGEFVGDITFQGPPCYSEDLKRLMKTSKMWDLVARELFWKFIKISPRNERGQIASLVRQLQDYPFLADRVRAAYFSFSNDAYFLSATRYARNMSRLWTLPNLEILSIHNFDFSVRSHSGLLLLMHRVTRLRLTQCSFVACLTSCDSDTYRAGPQLKELVVEAPRGDRLDAHTETTLVMLGLSKGIEKLHICAALAERVIPDMVYMGGGKHLEYLETRVTAELAPSVQDLLLMRPGIRHLSFPNSPTLHGALDAPPAKLLSLSTTDSALAEIRVPSTITDLSLHTYPALNQQELHCVLGLPWPFDNPMRAGKFKAVKRLELHVVNWFPDLLSRIFKHLPALEHINVFALLNFRPELCLCDTISPSLIKERPKHLKVIRIRMVYHVQFPILRYYHAMIRERSYALSTAEKLERFCSTLEEYSPSIWFKCIKGSLGEWKTAPINPDDDASAYRFCKAAYQVDNELFDP